jgi:hypothetical protein
LFKLKVFFSSCQKCDPRIVLADERQLVRPGRRKECFKKDIALRCLKNIFEPVQGDSSHNLVNESNLARVDLGAWMYDTQDARDNIFLGCSNTC